MMKLNYRYILYNLLLDKKTDFLLLHNSQWNVTFKPTYGKMLITLIFNEITNEHWIKHFFFFCLSVSSCLAVDYFTGNFKSTDILMDGQLL